MILAIFDLQVTPILPVKLSSFESTGLSVQEVFKRDFQDGSRDDHLECLIETVLATFVSWFSLQEKKLKNINIQERFSRQTGRGSRLAFTIKTILGTCNLQVMLL